MSLFIAIAGASASGKSYFANFLRESLQNEFEEHSINLLLEDSYYKPQTLLSIDERAKLNFDHPDAIDSELLGSHLGSLKQQSAIKEPVYCYKIHDRIGDKKVAASDILIVEGMHLLGRKQISDLIDFKIFIDTPLDICLMRRIARDTIERARTLESVLEQYENFVRPMFIEHILPSRENAHLVLNGHQEIENLWLTLKQNNKFKELITDIGNKV